jgi:paraquat-inducible protein B
MSANASYFKIGLFVILGSLLIVAGIVIFGAGKIFQEYLYVESYFKDSVQGLSVGSPMKFRGVHIGAVSEIALCNVKYHIEDPNHPSGSYVYVKIAIPKENMRDPRTGEQRSQEEARATLQKRIADGMRVRLAGQGITGLMYLEVDYLDPETNPVLPFNWAPEYPVVPSASGTMTRVTESLVETLGKIQKIDFEKLGSNTDKLLVTLESTVQKLQVNTVQEKTIELIDETRATVKRVREILEKPEMEKIPEDIGAMIADLRPKVKESTDRINGAVVSLSDLLKRVDALLARNEVSETLEELPGIAAQLRMSLQRLHRGLSTNQQNLTDILSNLAVVSENLEQITTNARKYPSQALLGSPPPPAKAGE